MDQSSARIIETIQTPEPFWKAKPFLLAILALFLATIAFASYKFLFVQQNTPAKQQANFEEAQIPINQEIDTTVVKKTKNSLTLAGGSKELTYNITDSTIIYKCTDFNDIKTCTQDSSDLKIGTAVRILTVKLDILYIFYK